jgi:hypothetical protein
MPKSMEHEKSSSWPAIAGCTLLEKVMSLILAFVFRKTMWWTYVSGMLAVPFFLVYYGRITYRGMLFII